MHNVINIGSYSADSQLIASCIIITLYVEIQSVKRKSKIRFQHFQPQVIHEKITLHKSFSETLNDEQDQTQISSKTQTVD